MIVTIEGCALGRPVSPLLASAQPPTRPGLPAHGPRADFNEFRADRAPKRYDVSAASFGIPRSHAILRSRKRIPSCMSRSLLWKDDSMIDSRRVASAAAVVGLLVGLVCAICWHVFVEPQFDSAGLAASAPNTAVAFEVGYLVEFFEPAPSWLPTTLVFPLFAAIVFGVLGSSCARYVSGRSPLEIGLESGVVGGCLGLGATAWAVISPPVYQGLTTTRPLRVDLTSQGFLWVVLPLCGGVSAAVVSASVVAISRKRSAARKLREAGNIGP